MIRAKILVVTLAAFSLASSVLAQEEPIRVKGGHELGETAERFFAEGAEKEAFDACGHKDFKVFNRSDRRTLKEHCGDLVDARRQATSGKRFEYKGGGDTAELRMDTFTFDGGRLVKVELLYSAPNAEVNYRGQTFEALFAGVKQTYGPTTSETTEPTQNAYGVPYVAHRELWIKPHGVILIAEEPGDAGSTTLSAFTRAEYDRALAPGVRKFPNPLQ